MKKNILFRIKLKYNGPKDNCEDTLDSFIDDLVEWVACSTPDPHLTVSFKTLKNKRGNKK